VWRTLSLAISIDIPIKNFYFLFFVRPPGPFAAKFIDTGIVSLNKNNGVAVISAKKPKRQRRKRQSVTAKREKSQTPQFLTAIQTLPNLT